MKKSPKISHHKRRGEWVELQFMARATGKGFTVSKPWGDSARYDFIVERRGRFRRVQVKSTMFRVGAASGCSPRAYMCGIRTGNKKGKRSAYRAKDIDFFACFVIPLDLWYIMPIAEMSRVRCGALLDPGRPANRYFRFLEAWHLLM